MPYQTEIDAYSTNPELREALRSFVEMRVEMSKRSKNPVAFTDRAFKIALTELEKLSGNVNDKDRYKTECLNRSVMNSWKGLFKLDHFVDSGLEPEPPSQITFGTAGRVIQD